MRLEDAKLAHVLTESRLVIGVGWAATVLVLLLLLCQLAAIPFAWGERYERAFLAIWTALAAWIPYGWLVVGPRLGTIREICTRAGGESGSGSDGPLATQG